MTVGSWSAASFGAAPDALRIGAGALQDRNDDAALLLEQREQQVRRGYLGVAARAGEPLRRGKRLLGLDGESISLHRYLSESIARLSL